MLNALEAVENIERPYGDNEGDYLNSPSVYNKLSPANRDKVDHAVEMVRNYVRNPMGEPDNRAITALNNHYDVSFHRDQYDPSRYVGKIRVGKWEINISDPSH